MIVPNSLSRTVVGLCAPTTSSEDFDRWIRMATDNKINTQNSWDLALIDYFHDLSLLRDGDGINFQKASATLDGCVKIYSSRVDSAVTETGILMNGLATRKNNQMIEEEDEDDELDSNISIMKGRQKVTIQRDTLVEFEVIKVRKMELKLVVGPLFKKALVEFDEGGSKSLLLNMLNLDSNQKIMFDTTDLAEPIKELEDNTEKDKQMIKFEQNFAEMDIDGPEGLDSNQDINVFALGEQFFGGCDFTSLSLCASLKELNGILNQDIASSNALKEIEFVNLKNYYDNQEQEDYNSNDVSSFKGYDDFDFGPDELKEDQNNSKYPGNRTSIFFNDLEDEVDDYGITIRSLFNESKQFTTLHDTNEDKQEQALPITNIPDEDLLAYFDKYQRRNWAGPDHWKVQNIKRSLRIGNNNNDKVPNEETDNLNQRKPKNKEDKNHLIIDFLSEKYPDEDVIFEQATNVVLPKKEWISTTKNLLPVDKHFSTRNFIHLFSKNQLIKNTFNKVKNMDNIIDENLYAELVQDKEFLNDISDLNNPVFFHDNCPSFGDGGIDLGNNYLTISESQHFNSQLTAKANQQSLLNYSRAAKKVDIKLLKDNIWDTLIHERSTRKSMLSSAPSLSTILEESTQQEDENLKFSEIVTSLTQKYDPGTKKELSTSFCFICLLHLANENGFTIASNKDNSDLIINNFQY